YCAPPPSPEECCIEEPICIKRHRRRRRHCRPTIPAPLPPIVIPIPMQEPAPQLQITEYIQDIYPPAQIYTDKVPVGYIAKNTVIQKPGQIQNQESLNCLPGLILPPSPYLQPQQQLIQQVPSGQCIPQQLMQQLSTGQCSPQQLIQQVPSGQCIPQQLMQQLSIGQCSPQQLI
ncbi:unnamed protein product, partial [Rotaria sordida]